MTRSASTSSPPDPRASAADHDLANLAVAALYTGDVRSHKTARVARYVYLATFLLAAWVLVSRRDSAVILERPVQSSTLGLAACAALLWGAGTLLQLATGRGNAPDESILLGDTRVQMEKGVLPLLKDAFRNPRNRRVFFTAIGVVVRVQAFKLVYKNIACSWVGIEALLPTIIAVSETARSSDSRPLAAVGNEPHLVAILRIGLAASLVAWAATVAARLGSTPQSTAICPATWGTEARTVWMQLLGVALDAWIFLSTRTLLMSKGAKSPSGPTLLASTLCMLSSAGILGSSLALSIFPTHRHSFLRLDWQYLGVIFWISCVVTALIISGAGLMMRLPCTDLVIMLSALGSLTFIRYGAMNSAHAEIHYSWMPAIFLLISGSAFYYYTTRHHSLDPGRKRTYQFLLYAFVALSATWILFSGITGSNGSRQIHTHPLRPLVATADRQHRDWATQATQSKNLQEAVENYKSRYHRHPPPGFDKWWEYATSRKSQVMDDFGSIEENLRPFWKVPPAQIRQRIKLLLSDTSNECAEVMIRNGEAAIGQVRPTHRWMVEGVLNMLAPFIKDLPDMDVAFNINDEPRVAVPYETWQQLKALPAESESEELSGSWSANRAGGWQISNDASSVDMDALSFHRAWRTYGAISCPPDSPARTMELWDMSTLCTSCYAPHSYGPFLANWTLASDPCHQPDLANLHGFYVSPSAFTGTHELLPIFSQSRAGGFADILYPTAWNYNDKVKYAPTAEFPDDEWAKKSNTVFWHGSATEGFSNAGTWRGQVRQRVVDLVNNSTRPHPVLFQNRAGLWGYVPLTTPQVLHHPQLRNEDLKTDVAFVDMYPRCDDGDCEAQQASLGLGPKTDFQAHWGHKFLLDMDGAGFSGRFLPFLQSGSLPFKMGIFREWYDERITPYKHFVPVDLRLHGLWSTVAFFAGRFEAFYELDRARLIAEDGREWARKVLRKEDMEIYMYRLLLEYARITDDNRAALGYVWKG